MLNTIISIISSSGIIVKQIEVNSKVTKLVTLFLFMKLF